MTPEFITKDSGERQQFSTGAQRDTSKGKGRYDLLYSGAIERDAKLYERGAAKYDDNNWKRGIPSSRFMESMLRHAFQYLRGDRSEDHLAAVRFNAAGIMYNEMEKLDQHNLMEKEAPEVKPGETYAFPGSREKDRTFPVPPLTMAELSKDPAFAELARMVAFANRSTGVNNAKS